MKLRTVLAAAVAALGLVAGASASTEYFVSKDGGSDGYDGLAASWDGAHGPKQTIQAAVNKAAAGDTVTVLPGVYDTGATYNSSAGATSNRVAITKAITLRSRDGAEVTVIKGAPDFAGEPAHGLGPAAVRCVFIANVAAVVRGFTLAGGYVNQGTGADGNGVRGGGIVCAGHSPVIVDCVIADNVATRGGGAFEGQYVRTVFTGNRVYSTAANKTTNGTVCRTCSLFGCVIVGNGASDCTGTLCSWLKEAVNCTFANNYSAVAIQVQSGTVYTGGSTVKNCYADGAAILTEEGYSTADHCVSGWGELAAPVLGDCRPLASGVLPGAGDPDALSLYPKGYAYVDILGNARTTDGKVAIGAVEAAVTPQGGKVVLASGGRDATVDGVKVAQPTNYFHAVEWPKQVYLRPAPSNAEKLFCHFATNTTGGVRYPLFNDREGGLWLTMPRQGETLTLTPQTGTVKYVRVDAADGGDGSQEKPYNTLSAAADAATGGDATYYVIKVGPGTYRTGGGDFMNGTTDWGNARVTLNKSNILLTSTDGAEKTVIEGAEAPGGGCGEGAYRCVILGNTNYRLAVSGFTLRNGYTQLVSSGSDALGHGGAFRSPKQASSEAVAFHQVLDSVIEDCAATRGPGGYGGWMVRCLIRNCVDASGGNATTRENVLSSCVLYDNTASHVVVGQNVKAYHCTGVGLSGKVNYYASTGSQLVSNCLFLDGNCPAANATPISGTFAETAGSRSDPRITYGPAGVADKEGRDLRLLATSPLIGGGDVSADGWAKFATSGFGNDPLMFVNGKPTVGACQRTATAVVVEPGPYVTCAEAGTHVVEPGESVTVTMSCDVRQFLGIRVDGVFHPGVTTCTVSPAAGAMVVVEGVTATDWYVDANAGDDANDGFTPATAKRTLVGAMAAAVAAGDTVHAAEGVYNEGKDRPASTKDSYIEPTLYSRVIVPEGVTLAADGRQTETVIEGGPASGPEDQAGATDTNLGSFQECFDKYGMGTDAVRCALLMPGATLRGFTLRGAASSCLNSENNENCIGAVMDRDYAACLVEDCLFTGNCVGRGSAAYVTANRCVFADNLAAWNCPVARFSELHNCLATGNCGNPLSDVCRGFYNCTFRDNWSSVSRISKVARLCYQTNKQWGDWDVKLVNSLILQDASSGSPNVFGTVVNSILSPNCYYTATNASVNVWTYPASEVLDAEGRPLLDGPAADKADASWYPAEWGDRDALGGQRVYNGALDIGAVEGDWRAAYAATLSSSPRLRVTAADPSVQLSGDGAGVEIPSGKLCVTWGRGVEFPGTFNAVVTGGGVLTISRAGVTIAEVRAGDSGEFKLDNLAAGTPLEFAYAPGAAGDEGKATLSSFKIPTGLAILIR